MMCYDAFINACTATVHLLATAHVQHGTAEQTLAELHAKFEQGIRYDAVDDSAAPVYVYTVKGEPVAWYDFELAEGYCAE